MDLLIHQGALGDWLVTFDLLRALAPGPLGVVTSASKGALAARLLPHVTPIDIEGQGWSALHAPMPAATSTDDPALVVPEVVARLRGAARIFSFVSRPDEAWARRVARLAPASRLYCVDPRPPADWAAHVADWHLRELRRQGPDVTPIPAPARLDARRADGPIVIHPGSGGAEKCWPVERFEAAIIALQTTGLAVLPVLGEVEMDRWPAPQVRRWGDLLGARPLASLAELAEVLDGARAFLGNDSGPAHLAAQMGLPTVALFGLTSPRLWSPRGPAVRVIAPDSPRAMTWLEVGRVVEACLQAAG